MKRFYSYCIGIVCLITSCSSSLDKSVSEPISRDEIVAICKNHDFPKMEEIITAIGSEKSLYRQLDGAALVKYSDLTYRDIIEFGELVSDSVKLKEIDAKYEVYEKEVSDSVWNKLLNIREEIKQDTSLNKYAKMHYELEDVKSFTTGKMFKCVSLKVDSYENDVTALGGLVTKVSKNASDSTVNFHFFELSKRGSSLTVKRSPTSAKDTLDYYSGEYDYSMNILWVQKGREVSKTSNEHWDKIVKSCAKTSQFMLLGTNLIDQKFTKSAIKNDKTLLKITDTQFQTRKEYRDSTLKSQMTEKNLRTKELLRRVVVF